MGIKDSLLIELEKETENTRRLLGSLSDEHWAYKPHPKSMSLGALATHIVELHNWVGEALTMDVFDFKVNHQPLKAEGVEALKEALNNGYDRNKASIETRKDEEWGREWTLKAGDWVLSKLPKAGAIRFIVNNHLIHHRGQLTVYLRLLDIPVPGLYGPSADE